MAANGDEAEKMTGMPEGATPLYDVNGSTGMADVIRGLEDVGPISIPASDVRHLPGAMLTLLSLLPAISKFTP